MEAIETVYDTGAVGGGTPGFVNDLREQRTLVHGEIMEYKFIPCLFRVDNFASTTPTDSGAMNISVPSFKPAELMRESVLPLKPLEGEVT